ncbi:MAG: energy transducer TonB [Sphingomonas sp.]
MIPLLLAAALAAIPAGPMPRSAPTSWITPADHPAEGLRSGQQGDVSFTLDVDATGRVSDCTITRASGFSVLDRATCWLVQRRGRFTPATDAAGNPVAGAWPDHFNWTLPR